MTNDEKLRGRDARVGGTHPGGAGLDHWPCGVSQLPTNEGDQRNCISGSSRLSRTPCSTSKLSMEKRASPIEWLLQKRALSPKARAVWHEPQTVSHAMSRQVPVKPVRKSRLECRFHIACHRRRETAMAAKQPRWIEDESDAPEDCHSAWVARFEFRRCWDKRRKPVPQELFFPEQGRQFRGLRGVVHFAALVGAADEAERRRALLHFVRRTGNDRMAKSPSGRVWW